MDRIRFLHSPQGAGNQIPEGVMMITPSYGWLIFGVACFALEAMGISGIGFFFAGLGAVSVGILIETSAMGTATLAGQFGWFFLATTVWTILLWKTLKKFRVGGGKSDYSNMVGDSGTVASASLVHGTPGEVRWSGTTMHARLADSAKDKTLKQGDRIRIVDVKGTTLIVEPE